jgi:hypothetical protein
MKVLIIKLGMLFLLFNFFVGVTRNLPLFTAIFRSFVAFLVFEGILVLMAVIFIKITESLRVSEFEESIESESMEE